ncbi:radical SAM superfamily protein [bacterium BMS3Abin07]|nr:radical SAM superfamily protein [bacterium BMS3Abin07]GBE31412.1 radical SAM superfamily protein [bacterium BMS3Bbin05]HDL21241.1 radical SAM protein [Nitrospirota bacterium]HDO22195.1 radical SAM protein [Nitrospirota bacterium]HDZ87335.1 radical SAM protein [Nitrospirota bacterium]
MDIDEKIRQADEILTGCTLCPRRCGVNRKAGEHGFCRTADKLIVSSWGPHFGEERPLVGRGGSGTIFFTNCNLGCFFCQNYPVSHLSDGSEMSEDKLASVMIDLQNMGCENINLVTPTHQVPMILKALKIAFNCGLRLPVVYNSGGYESVDTLKILQGVVDIFMPDFKYANPRVSEKYSLAKDYPDIAKAALKEMHRQVSDLLMNERGVAVRGLLVRHLVMPQGIAGTEEVVRFIAEEISVNTYLNIMDQYHPCYKAFEYPEISRRISEREYKDAINYALKAGIKRID